VVRLYLSDPTIHAYLLYDLVYELERTDAAFEVEGDEVVGYLLVWWGPRAAAVHLWGRAEGLVDGVPCSSRAVVVVHTRELLERVRGFLAPKGELEVREHLEMVVDERGFAPHPAGEAVRLRPDDERHVRALLELMGWQDLGEGEVKRLLARNRYYGIFAGERLVSVAGTHLRTPEVWVVGNVYTHPDYRGRGYAKAVTSAVTRDALSSGARALLHAAEGNEPAIRVYRSLGYEVVGRKPWVLFSP